MTAFFKIVDENGYVSGFGRNGSDGLAEITESEYNALAAMFAERPAASDGYFYVIRDNPREWVLVEVPVDPDPEIDDAEALSILLGGGGE